MLFSSIPFLYFFLPLFLFIYFLAPFKLKNLVILLFSLIFYAWGEIKYVFLMMFMIILGYIYGILLERFKRKPCGKFLMTLSVVSYLMILGYFKYMDFFIANIRQITGQDISLLNIALPIGISFYIFQLLSYNIDVYRGEVEAQKNIIALGTYISMFPQLIAGPIVRYKDIRQQLSVRSHTVDKIYSGLKRFLVGLGKKILIANILGECCAHFKNGDERDLLFFWIYGISYMLHIYFDFSGYSDMAIGLGRILGFEFMENFHYPYVSTSITEFWRRWHISLGTWFKDYVYIPLGGNRVSKSVWIRNILLVWFLTGFWHGASWNFILWGIFFAFFLILEKQFLLERMKNSPVLSRIYVLFFIMVSFILFDSVETSQALRNIGGLFGIGVGAITSEESIYYGKSYLVIIIFAAVAATPLGKVILGKWREREGMKKILPVGELAGVIIILLLGTAYLVDGSFNPFLYFRF